MQSLRKIIKKIYIKIFFIFEKLGIHITYNYYYSPIPNIHKLDKNIFSKKYELIGVNVNDNFQNNMIDIFVSNFKSEYENIPENRIENIQRFYYKNEMFSNIDAEVLYSFVRYFKPKNIIEIGSGFSTLLISESLEKNKYENPNYECNHVSIEPYPRDFLKKGVSSLKKLITKNVQEIDLNFFNILSENDILLIDSSHVVKIGSDVCYEILEILPRLNKGVIIHFHDIFLPAEYSKNYIIDNLFFWNEQYLLHAFLTFNDCFEVIWGSNYMHIKYPEKLEKAFSKYKGKGAGGSLWIRKIK
jgi:hypothetical protein